MKTEQKLVELVEFPQRRMDGGFFFQRSGRAEVAGCLAPENGHVVCAAVSAFGFFFSLEILLMTTWMDCVLCSQSK